MPKVARHVARRLTGEIESKPAAVERLVELIANDDAAQRRRGILLGMAEALRGWSKAPAPAGWQAAVKAVAANDDDEQASLVRELSIVFGTGVPREDVIAFIRDLKQPKESRRQAMQSLVAAGDGGVSELLQGLLADRDVGETAVRGLAAVDLKGHARLLLASYPSLNGPAKDAVVAALTTRADTAALLLDAVEAKKIPKGEVDAHLLRQMQLLGDDALVHRIMKLWPKQQLIAEDKLQRINSYRQRLAPAAIAAADLANGRAVYTKTCAQCHKLFGEGSDIGPELTGSQRTNLAYLLENMIDPSAIVADQYRMSVVTLNDGRVLSGIIGQQNQRTVSLQTPTERVVLERTAIDTIEPSPLSLMPDGQLETLSDNEVRDLIAYLMSSGQVGKAQ
jgi:putative heme-binding domain-containing protein